MKNNMRRNGFTLVELLAVMAVIGILAGLVLGISGYASYKSDEAKTKADIEHIKQLLQQYRVDHGVLPQETANWWEDKAGTNWEEAIEELDETFYIETDELKDPWGKKYQYKRDTKYVAYIWSMGPDGSNKTKDDIGEFPPK